jgi:hypothetical protein
MAENSEEVILKIRIDYTESEKDLKKLTSTIKDLKKSNDDNTEAIARAEKAAKANQEATKAEEGSIKALREENKKLTEQRNTTTTLTEAGRAKVAQLNAELDKNNLIIKANVDAYTKQKIGIGNYTEGILNAVPGLKGFTGGITGLNTAFKANPIGAVVTLLFALKGVFESNAVIADKLSFAFDGLKKGLGFIVDTIVTTVTSFDRLKQAITSPLQFFKELATGTVDAAKAGYEAAESIDSFAEATAIASQQIEINEVRVKSLEKSLKDKTKSEQERIKIANQVADLEIHNAKKREELASQELANEQLRLKGKTLSGEELAQLKRLETRVFVEQEEAKTASAERQTRINILLAKEEAGEKIKQIELVAEKVQQVSDQEFANDLKRLEERKKASEDYTAEIIVDIGEEEAAKDEAAKRDAQRISDTTKFNKAQLNQDVANTGAAINAASALFKKGSMEQKAIASAGAVINTYQAAAAALAPPPTGAGPILGPIFAAIAIASGLANVAKINSTPAFASGGLTGTRISPGMGSPISRSNGDNMLATVKTGEVILNERQQARLGGASTFARIGVPGFATGGITATNQVASQINTANEIKNAVAQAVKNIAPVLVLQDFERVQGTRNEIQTTAQVI